MDTPKEDEALRIELCDIPTVSEDIDNDMTGSTTGTNDEKGAASCVKTITNMNENDSESTRKVRVANDNPADDTSDNVSSVADDVSEVRRLRTLHINEWLTDEKVQAVRQGTRDSGANAIAAIRDTLNEAQQGKDLAFAAGTLATPAGIASEDSVGEHIK